MNARALLAHQRRVTLEGAEGFRRIRSDGARGGCRARPGRQTVHGDDSSQRALHEARVDLIGRRVVLARVVRLGRRLRALIQHPRAAEVLVDRLETGAVAANAGLHVVRALQTDPMHIERTGSSGDEICDVGQHAEGRISRGPATELRLSRTGVLQLRRCGEIARKGGRARDGRGRRTLRHVDRTGDESRPGVIDDLPGDDVGIVGDGVKFDGECRAGRERLSEVVAAHGDAERCRPRCGRASALLGRGTAQGPGLHACVCGRRGGHRRRARAARSGAGG